MKSNKEHTFVICAYKESEYLEECICSLIKQKDYSEIIMVTSTPNNHINSLAQKYSIPLFVNKGEGGITQDWEFALSKASTQYVTIAHQDDLYEPDYAMHMLESIKKGKHSLIAFSDYYEIKDGKKISNNKLLKIKRLLLSPLKISLFMGNKFVRRRIISLGNPICCPSVTYNLANIELPVFKHHFRSNEDWEAWEKLSKVNGEFVYISDMLMGHRIHEGSETSIIINDDSRSIEDYEMFKKFWPDGIARFLVKKYKESEKSNKL